MTDKQIIIDGVPVQDCCYFDYENDGYEDSCYIHQNECSAQNCYYKQLKHKEQEYEELRKYHNKCCEEFEKEKKEWLEKYNQISRGFYNGDYCNTEHCSLLQAKEQECEELKKIIDEAKNSKLDLKSFLVGEAIQNECEQQLDQLKGENEKYSLFIEKLCDYAGLECDSEEQAMRTLSDLASQMNKARWIIDRYKQTLAEIKEIAEVYEELHGFLDCSGDLILQKISEVE